MATNVEVSGTGVAALAGVALLGLVGLWLYSKRGAIAEAAQAVNPASDKNIVYQGVNAVTQAATGKPGISFGSWLYDVTHPNQPDPTAPTPIPNAGYQVWDSILARKAREAAGMGLGNAGFIEALGEDGRKEYLPPPTPATWLLIAGASVALYAHSKKRRRGRRR